MKLLRLVSTYELRGVQYNADKDWRIDLRVEVFESSGKFGCRVWSIEEFRIIPLHGKYGEIEVGDGESYADKVLLTEMDALKFDEIRCDSEEEAVRSVVDMIRKLFGIDVKA